MQPTAPIRPGHTEPARPGIVKNALIGLLSLFVIFISLPAAVSAAGVKDHKVVDGSLTWGVKESFRHYMTGGIAHGKITASGDAKLDQSNISTYQKASGLVKSDGTGVIDYKGAVAYYGHGGELDFTLSDPQLTLEKDGKGHLDVTYRFAKQPAKAVRMAELSDVKLTVANGTVSFDKAKTKLAKDGVEIFSYKGSGFYPEGQDLDPLSSRLVTEDIDSGTVTPPTPTVPPTTEPTPHPTSTAPTSKPSPTTSNPSTGTTTSKPQPSASNPKPSQTSKPTAPSKPSTGSSSTADAALTWGVKQTFRTYIVGPIAHGKIATSGHASAVSGGFRFPQASTSANPPSPKGTTTYSGTVHFTGHDGILDVTFSNPRVVATSDSSATLVVDYKGPSGGTQATSLANLDLSRAKKSARGDAVTYQSTPATLTSAGVKVFSYQGNGFYPAGIQLDPVSFTIAKAAHVTGKGTGETAVSGSQITASAPGDASTPATSAATSGPAPAAAAAAPSSTGAGSLVWGVRSSFRSYILGPIAHGAITVGDGASASGAAWAFPQSGQKSADGGASYTGSIHFTGHSGILDLKFSSPSVHIDSASRATLYVTVNGAKKDMVTLDLSRAGKSTQNGATVYTGAPATLTGSGAGVFSYRGHAFYPTGSSMDPVTFSVGSPGSPASGSGSVSTTTTSTSATSADVKPGTTDSTPPKSATPASACTATGTNLTWGFKESFRSYISGSIANGEWTPADGAQYKTPNFIWPAGKGVFDQKSGQGSVTFAGSVHFTGHEGLLDTVIANPTVELAGDKAYLRMDVKSTLMEAAMSGKKEWYENKQARFVELDATKITTSTKDGKTVLTGTDVGTTLTKDGSAAFPNYTAGTAFDPISFELTADSSCVKKAAATPSASATPSKSAKPVAQAAPAKSDANGGGNGWLPWLGGGAIGAVAAGGVAALMRARATSHAPANNGDWTEEGGE